MPPLGLTTISTEHLRRLLRAVFKEELECPVTPAGLAAIGLQDVSAPLLSHLRGLDSTAIHAVVVAVIAEREGVTDRVLARRALGRG